MDGTARLVAIVGYCFELACLARGWFMGVESFPFPPEPSLIFALRRGLETLFNTFVLSAFCGPCGHASRTFRR